MRDVGQFASLSTVLADVEAAVSALTFTDEGTAAVSYSLLDRLDQWTHLGVIVAAPETAETDKLRKAAWLEDTITVELRASVARTPGQRASRNSAIEHEERIRFGITNSTALRRYRPDYRRTTRRPGPDAAWLALVLTFTLTRFELVERTA